MERDMDLVRAILLSIEKDYRSMSICNLTIPGYDMQTIAYHCKIIKDKGLIFEYRAQYADNDLRFFWVGALTWEGNDFLDKIRDDSIWKKTKETIVEKGLPVIIETISTITTAFITAAAEGVSNSIIKNQLML